MPSEKWPGPRGYEKSGTSEIEILERLELWREALGHPLGGGRANPDNDLIYLMSDAAECIRGLRQYACHLETALGGGKDADAS